MRHRGRAIWRCFFLLDVSKLVIPLLMCPPVVGREWSQLGKLTSFAGGADKSLAQPGRKQATATEDFDFRMI